VRTRYLFVSLSLLCVATPVRAELVYFTTGRALSVSAHRIEGDSLVLTLRNGGEVVCDRALVTRIAPDEVPYPEPQAPVLPAAEPPPAETGQGPDRSAYNEIINRVAAREGVDPRLVRAVIEVESGYQPRARSPKGAMGLMQLMPATARQYALKNPYDPAANIEAGTRHLKSLLARFPRELALAAYNAGHVAVERFGGIPPYAETRNYVSRVLRLVARS
jgi:soluble lytic murein transglycosylase-like protein